jgi:peroxin-2
MASSLQKAWENAQPKLDVIRNALGTQISPQQRIIRVGQLDSELLDQELVHLLKEPLNRAIALINVCAHILPCNISYFPLVFTQGSLRA